MKRKRIRIMKRIFGLYLPLAAFLFFALFPFYWMTLSSFKANPELYNLRANRLWIQKPTLEQFKLLFKKTAILHWLRNSFFVSFATALISLTLGIMAGYALARLKFPGARGFGLATFITYLVPTTLLFIPLARVVQTFRLQNTIWSLIATYPTFLIPFCTWMLIAYFKSIPKAMEECAMIDGCGRIRALIQIVLPMSIPGIVFSGMFSFTLSWNEFVYALTFISSTYQKTMSVAVPTELIRGDAYFWGELMAASLIGSVPVALFYSFFMDYFVSGLTAGALKGAG
jgi:multiple sugar transport system permease protein